MALTTLPNAGDMFSDAGSGFCLHVHCPPAAGTDPASITLQVDGTDMVLTPCPCKPLTAAHKSSFASAGATSAQVAAIDAAISSPKGFHPELLVQLAMDLLASPRNWAKIVADFEAVFAA
jgi:hypothetical protein